MKLTKNRLRQIIAEEILRESQEDATRLSTQQTTASNYKKASRERSDAGGKEVTGAERGILQQIEDYYSNLAAEPGIDLQQHKVTLQRVLKMLETTIASKAKGEEK